MHRPVVFLTGGQQTRLVLLQVDGTDAADSRCVQAIFREHCLHRTHYRFGRDAPPAAYAYPQHAGNQPQGAGKGCSDVPADENAQRAGLPGKRTLRQGDRQVKLATKRHVPLQYRRRYRLGKPHVGDGTAVPGGPCVHGEFSPDVGGGGDHRRGVQLLRQLFRQRVGAADVAGEQGDHKLPRLVDAHHRRVGFFAFDIGGDLPHGDAAGPHKDQCVHGGKAHIIYRLVQRQKARLFKTRHGIAHPYLLRQRLQYPPRRGTAAPAVGKQGGSHWAPLRNSVVKSGWYSSDRR